MPRHVSLGSSVLEVDHNILGDVKRSEGGEIRTLGLLGVIVIGFFWVAGGIYGNEELISSGAPGLILCGLVLGGLLFAFPFALMCAELATTYPENGGVIVPVRYALGMTSANHMAYLNWIVNALDASIYPLLAAEYLKEWIPDSVNENVPYADKICISYPIVLIVTAFNLLGLNWVVRFSNVIFVFALTPCLIYIGAAFIKGDVAWDAFTEIDGGSGNTSLTVSWIIWLYSGFVSLGILAGEVKNPQRTFLGAVLILVPLTICLNITPIIVSLAIDPNADNYDVGYFETLAKEEVGLWLKYGFIIGSTSAYIGLYNSQIVSAQEAFAFLIEANVKQQVSELNFTCWKYFLPILMSQDDIKNARNDNNNNNVIDDGSIIYENEAIVATSKQGIIEIEKQQQQQGAGYGSKNTNHLMNSTIGESTVTIGNSSHVIENVLTSAERDKANLEQATLAEDRPRTIRARRFYVLVNFLLIILFSWIDYGIIVQAEMLVNNVPLFLLCYSFIHLRFFDENRVRPFQVPGGIIGACIIVFIPSVVLILYTIVTVQDEEDRFLKLALFFVIVMLGFIVHLIWKIVSWIQSGARWSMPSMFGKNDNGKTKSELISESSDVGDYMTFGMGDGNKTTNNKSKNKMNNKSRDSHSGYDSGNNRNNNNNNNNNNNRHKNTNGKMAATPDSYRPTHNDYKYFRPYVNENDDMASSNLTGNMYDNISGLHVHNVETFDPDSGDDAQSELVSDLYGSKGM